MKHYRVKLNLIAAVATGMMAFAPAEAAGLTDFRGIENYVERQARVPGMPAYCFMPDGLSYLQLSDDNRKIERFDTKTGKVIEVVVDATHTRENTIDSFDGFELSPDGTKVMVWTNSRPIYRHSFDAEYYFYEIRSRLLRPLSTEHKRQQAPVFSPNGRMIAFMADNNIFIKKLDYLTEVPVTTDGVVNEVINGVPDWTYQEEFATTSSMAWSADNLSLCYIKYNEAAVPSYTLQLFEGSCDPLSQYSLYPGQFVYKYPVAGQVNAKASVHSYDVETRKNKDIALTDSRIEYIPRIAFAPGGNDVMITTLNRAQTRMELYMANPRSAVAKSILTEESKCWLSTNVYEDLTLESDGFVMFSSRTGYDQLYRYSYSGALQRRITTGDYDVTAYYGYDAAKGLHYYQAASSSPLDRTVSAVDRKGVVTALSPAKGYAVAHFSPAMNYFALNYSTAEKVPVYTMCAAPTGKSVRVISDNADYARRYASLTKREFFTFRSDDVELNGYMIRPADADGRRCPVIMYQYSGPGSQEVLNRWKVDWTDYAATQGYVVVCVDGRGTGGRGRAFMDVVYRRLGYYETIDQINAARYIGSLPFVDASRIGIHGWSYGGYETLMLATAPNTPFAAAVAVAPVTDWRLYDTVYAERYMLTPQENEQGYRESAPMNRVSSLACPTLIMYGTLDDNVHPANTIEFVGALQGVGKWCDMMAFPNMNHSINGCNSRSVVYGRLIDYFNKNLK
ncbi:MAG: prolyl oligopeptidase family serine peptidase [Bacteroidales bacterium]|nr:prolyl oligopeptidase family serine peptidase [Bacteroidales bacterium]